MTTSLAEASAPGDGETDQGFAPGSVLVGRYRVLGVLGEGGMGKVYLAEHLEVGRKVAIKVLLAEWSAHPSIVRRFRAEARTASAIGHPNIVQVFDAGSLPDGRLFLVMEHLAGRDLADELAVAGVFAPRRACMLVRQVALALGAGHRAGVVHRDMKPGNVMVVSQAGGEVAKVLDFGIAANPTIGGALGDRLTDPGSLVGTPEYMAPEQAAGEPPSPSFDVYAVGVMLHELLTGEVPLTAEHAFELLSLKLHQPAPPLAGRRPALPAALARLVDACLAIDPAARPADGDALAARIEAVLEDMDRPGAPARPASARAAGPRRTALVIAAGLAVAGVVAFAVTRTPAAVAVAEASSGADASPAAAASPVITAAVAASPGPSAPPVAEPMLPVPEEMPDASGGAATADAPKDMPEKTARPRPASRPAPAGDEHLTPRCERVRSTAEQARRSQWWGVLRDSSRQRECWASAAEARKLQTKALMELGDFTGCMSVGKGLKDQEVQMWLKLCQKRAGG